MTHNEQERRDEADREFNALSAAVGVSLPSIYLRPDGAGAGLSLDDVGVIAARLEALSGARPSSGSMESDGPAILRAAYILDRLSRALGMPLEGAIIEPGTQFIHLTLAQIRAITVRLEALRDGNALADGHL